MVKQYLERLMTMNDNERISLRKMGNRLQKMAQTTENLEDVAIFIRLATEIDNILTS